MVRICPHCGLPLSSTGSGEHSVPPSQGFVASLADGCLFSTDEADFPLVLCMTSMGVPEDGSLRTLGAEPFFLVGLPEDRVIQGDQVRIRFRAERGLHPLPACRLRAHAPSAELIWSWFRQAYMALTNLHEQGLVHGRLDENLFWIHSGGGPGAAVDNRMHLLVPTVSRPGDPAQAAAGRAADLRAIGDLFERLLMETAWQRGLDEFRELCLALRDAPDAGSTARRQMIVDSRRMAQLQAPEVEPLLKKVAWKKPALIFGVLFSLSLIATWIFSGTKEKPPTPAPEPTLLKPPPQVEPMVERSNLKWDPAFPLHRVAMNDTALLYLNPARIPEFEFLAEAVALLGFTIPAAFLARDTESALSILLSGDKWKSRVMFSMVRKQVATEPGAPDAAPAASDVAGAAAPASWVTLTGSGRLLKPDAISPPPLLLGELGAQLTSAGYIPEKVDAERLVLIFAPPTTLAPRHTIWHWLLGGIRPTYVVLRLSGTTDVFTCVLTYERPQDAAGAAAFLENTLRVAGLPGKDLQEVRDRRLRLQVPLSLLHDLWKASRLPPPDAQAPASKSPPEVPSPPLVPIDEEIPQPPPVPMEFLSIPDP